MLFLESRYFETIELFMCWEKLVGLERGEKVRLRSAGSHTPKFLACT